MFSYFIIYQLPGILYNHRGMQEVSHMTALPRQAPLSRKQSWQLLIELDASRSSVYLWFKQRCLLASLCICIYVSMFKHLECVMLKNDSLSWLSYCFVSTRFPCGAVSRKSSLSLCNQGISSLMKSGLILSPSLTPTAILSEFNFMQMLEIFSAWEHSAESFTLTSHLMPEWLFQSHPHSFYTNCGKCIFDHFYKTLPCN